MNRVIKFRAWDAESMSKNYATIQEIYSKQSMSRDPNKLVWLQFTGLTDKNGKEIYEGDIIKYYNIIAQIKYHDKLTAFVIYTKKDNNTFLLCDAENVYSLEVIGNIFENPELIK